jgi:hypothetical protein
MLNNANPKTLICVTAHVHISVRTPVALAPPYVKAQCIAHGQVTYAHPVISLMNHTGDDIE